VGEASREYAGTLFPLLPRIPEYDLNVRQLTGCPLGVGQYAPDVHPVLAELLSEGIGALYLAARFHLPR
jgi:hypothetical protein